MQRVEIRDLHKIYQEYADKEIIICGWARTIRDSKNIAFVEINDGAFKSVQVASNCKVQSSILNFSKLNFSERQFYYGDYM